MRHTGYPYVGRTEDEGEVVIVLFIRPDTGIALQPTHDVGDFSDQWPEHHFAVLDERIAFREVQYILEIGYAER